MHHSTLKRLRLEAEKTINKASDELCHLFENDTPIDCGEIGFCVRSFRGWGNDGRVDFAWFDKPLNLQKLKEYL